MVLRKLMPILVVLLAAGCTSAVSTGRQPVALVSSIAADKTDAMHIMLASASGTDRFQDIAVLGSEMSCAAYGDMLSACDIHDNIDGRGLSDSLADFAGETISLYRISMDDCPDAQSMRTTSVRLALAALDTACSRTSFDVVRTASKGSCKTIIISSPYLERYGRFDVDTLFALTGCGVELISPISTMLDNAEIGSGSSIGFLCNAAVASTELYKGLIEDEFARRNIKAETFVYAVTDTVDVMRSFLDAYAQSGSGKPLDAIITGICAGDVNALKAELDGLISLENEESLTYGGIVSSGFRFVNELDAVASCCFKNLRDRNLFTHNIMKPELKSYSVSSLRKGEEEIFITVPTE